MQYSKNAFFYYETSTSNYLAAFFYQYVPLKHTIIYKRDENNHEHCLRGEPFNYNNYLNNKIKFKY